MIGRKKYYWFRMKMFIFNFLILRPKKKNMRLEYTERDREKKFFLLKVHFTISFALVIYISEKILEKNV